MANRSQPWANGTKRRLLQRFPVPWGLFVALGLYALAVTGYVAVTYWSSPEYQAALHYNRAKEILGRSAGRSASREALLEAYEHLLEAALRMPQLKQLHEELESLNWRFEERAFKLPPDFRQRAEAVAAVWQRIQLEQQPILVVGVRSRGWAPDQLAEGPERAVRWSAIGALLIGVVWAWGRFNEKRLRAIEHEQEVLKMEREVKDLAGLRPPPEVRRPPR